MIRIPAPFHCALAGIAMLCASGCFGTVQHTVKYLWAFESHHSINNLSYEYLGSAGPDAIWVRNKYDLKARLPFDTGHFPGIKDADDLNLIPSEVELLRAMAEGVIRDYFGASKEITLITFKIGRKEEQDEPRTWLIDATIEGRHETIIETLARHGLIILDTELLKDTGFKRIGRLQLDAMRSRLGIWQHARVNNPHWHD